MPLIDFVYRVERHAIPTNPYASTAPVAIHRMQNEHCETPHTPPPTRDGLEWEDFTGPNARGQIFGFASAPAARTWFAGWHALLAAEGFFLATYLVDPDDVTRGGRQLVFNPTRAVRVSIDPLTWH